MIVGLVSSVKIVQRDINAHISYRTMALFVLL
uniref:Uncharacterized protein n=1 Tax=Anguilla anguilla TaxID=7936 RepID=A0A0E9WQ89_ANGAN